MNSNKTRAVLFDHDGTLVDSEGCHFQQWKAVLASFGVDFSENEYKNYCAGIPTPANAVDLVFRYDLSVSPFDLENLKIQANRDHLAQSAFPLMPGAKQAVMDLYAAGFVLGIVTGAGKEGLNSTVKAHGLEQYVRCLVCAEDVVNGKPAPDCYKLALQRLEIGATDTLAIEDTSTGVTAAVNAGITCLAVPNKLSAQQNFDKAHLAFGHLTDVVDWILDR